MLGMEAVAAGDDSLVGLNQDVGVRAAESALQLAVATEPLLAAAPTRPMERATRRLLAGVPRFEQSRDLQKRLADRSGLWM